MRNTSASKLPARKLLGAVIAATLFIPTSGFTLGLGEIEVNSALNQKLSADIELLSTTPEDSENIIVKLASRKDFTRAGLDRPYALNDLRFKAEIINGVPHIIVTSGSPIREPFLNFLVEVDWPNGHLLREYTVLLDPPVFMTQAASAPVQQARLDSRPSSSGTIYATPTATTAAPVVRAPVVRQPVVNPQVKQPKVQAAPPVASQPAQRPVVRQPVQQQVIQQQVQAVWNPPVANEYRIKAGDTAWRLAEAMRPDQSVSMEQMMVAMLQHNPDSFIDGNINGLRRGYVLRVPDYQQITSVSKDSAKALVRNQAALWRQYQQVKTGEQLASAMEKSPGQSVDSRASSSQAVKEDDAHLAIVSAGTGSSTASSKDPTQMTAAELRAELSLARERIETERVEKEGLQQKLSQLKANSKEVDGMFSIEDDQLSDVQAMNLPADGMQPETKLGETLAELKEATETAADDTATEMQDAAANASEKAGSEMTTDSAENTDNALFVDETAAQNGENNTAAEQVTAESASEVAQPQPVTTGQQSWIDQIMNNPVIAGAVGGGLLLLLGLFGWMFKRGKSEADDVAVASEFDNLENLADEVAEEQAAESSVEDEFDPDTTTSLDASDEAADEEMPAESTTAKEDEQEATDEDEPRDDVIAEADVYLAYGIYQQAEELLVQAIADNPDRHDYRLKLAEVHYASKNADAFVQTATEIKAKAGEDSSIWKKVLVMGQDLCSDNDMFQGSLIGGLDLDSVTPQAPEMDLDLGLDAGNDIESNADTVIEAIDEEVSELELPEVEGLADVEDVASKLETGELEPVEELEFDLSDTGAIENVADSVDVDEDEFSIDIETSELDISDTVEGGDTDIDFGLEEIADEVVATETTEDEIVAVMPVEDSEEIIGMEDDEEEISLDLTEEAEVLNIAPNVDTEEDVAAIEKNSEEISMDSNETADSFELDLDDDSIEIISDSAADDDDFDLSALDDVDEISTKLDLARAYLDMGDTEGTRSILEEVVAEGNDDQKDEANTLMAKLG